MCAVRDRETLEEPRRRLLPTSRQAQTQAATRRRHTTYTAPAAVADISEKTPAHTGFLVGQRRVRMVAVWMDRHGERVADE